ncbi:TonB-dependent receptor domain-containing protein [Pseudothauera nasutitermitis]|nr:TonB-dependent receptor [Pseudothauera nasutitermitis]
MAALLVAFSASSLAQESRQLGEVVVSASGFEQEIRQAPASISVITRDELQTKQFRDLAEALQDVEGVDVRGGTGKTGGLDISIRGMPSDYTLILIDGRRQNVAGNVTPNGFNSALTSFMPPLSAIERIEVIRGPMSTLYGSDAMGGVINIITRKVAKEWNGSVTLEAGIPEDSDYGDSKRVDLYVNGPLVEDLVGLAVRGGIFRRAESDWVLAPNGRASGRNPAPAESRQYNVGARLTLTPNRAHDFWLDVERNQTWYNNDDCRLGNVDTKADGAGGGATCLGTPVPTIAPGYKDYLRFNRDQIALGHTSRLSFGMLESSLTHSTTETVGRTIPGNPIGSTYTVDGKTFTVGDDRELETTNIVLDSKLVAPIGESHVATVGGQYWNAELVDGLLPKKHDQTMWSLFAEDEWSFTDSLTATFGARYDHHDAFGGEVSPRAYLVWNATERWTVKGGVSKGFKAPRLDQLIDGINGVGSQGASIGIGNPDLKPETSTSTELGVRYDSQGGLTASATAFHNKIKDKISNSGGDCATDPIPGCSYIPAAQTSKTYSVNIDEAKTWGLELTTRIPLAARWALNLNYTWTDSEIIENGRKNGKLGDTAKHVANAQLRWDATDKLSLWLRGEYRGKARRFDGDPKSLAANNNTRLEYEALGDLKAYSLFHLGGAYRVSKDVTINANIFNLLDKDFRKFKQWTNNAGAQVWGSEYFKSTQSTKGTTPAGRTFWISANIGF